ncbi:MAG: phospho-sugar mutase [Clostridia bacterium]|jgi:phosphoglucomutase/phosphomannomutase alpha/beta/alpha domain I|nr:phospho-sugar mutase [Clostridium sp.]MEE0127753.1 phospho-sugar mutase [Clostridia bacterium]HJJ11954.1 phospho-sugar mutase [Clostridiaceae bacterium]
MEYLNEYKKWCTSDVFDEETKKELLNIKDNKKEIEDRFYKELEFGTAGLRGIIGAGTNRMNIYTVGKATQGLANYIKKNNGEERGVAIAFDSRHMSKEFSEEAALILNANGIKTYLFDSLRPVPELSFAVRELNCIAGIMITASHNPPKYNGYKVYWEDGAQIVPPVDKDIINEVKAIEDYKEIKKISKAEGERKKLYTVIGKEIDEKYMEALEKLVLNPEIIKKQKDLKIVYTPLHGTGNIPVKTILNKLGFEKVYIVKEEEKPNGDFPTVDYPNPEDPKAFKLALKLAKEKDADIVLATDPDADRLGVYAKDSKTGEYKSFTGNMSGLLIAEYELSQKRERNNIPQNGILIKTIVSSNLADAISKKYNIQLKEVLTGFKYIGEQIKIFEKTNENTYLFGFEESYGCLIGTHARDKDGIAAVMALCEAAAYYKEKGFTLWDQMINIYEEYGYYKEDLLSITLEGVEGASKIKEMMENLRNNIPTRIGEYKVEKFRDYKTEKIINMETKEEEKTGLPESNVLYFDLENDFWVCVRPSGTEPKIKFYVGVKGSNIEDAEIKVKKLKEDLNEIIEM